MTRDSASTTRSEVVFGGPATIPQPRVRTAAGEVLLPTFQTMAATGDRQLELTVAQEERHVA